MAYTGVTLLTSLTRRVGFDARPLVTREGWLSGAEHLRRYDSPQNASGGSRR